MHAENGDVVATNGPQELPSIAGNNGPEAHAYSRPPEVEGEATNKRAIMIADMAGVPVYMSFHTSSARRRTKPIRGARQKGMRVFGEPLIQHLLLNETGVPQPGLGLRRPAGNEPALPQQAAPGFALGRAGVGLAADGRDRPLRLHDGSRTRTSAAIPRKSRTVPAGWRSLQVLWTERRRRQAG